MGWGWWKPAGWLVIVVYYRISVSYGKALGSIVEQYSVDLYSEGVRLVNGLYTSRGCSWSWTSCFVLLWYTSAVTAFSWVVRLEILRL